MSKNVHLLAGTGVCLEIVCCFKIQLFRGFNVCECSKRMSLPPPPKNNNARFNLSPFRLWSSLIVKSKDGNRTAFRVLTLAIVYNWTFNSLKAFMLNLISSPSKSKLLWRTSLCRILLVIKFPATCYNRKRRSFFNYFIKLIMQ